MATTEFDRVMRMGINDFACSRCKAAVGAPCRTAKGDETNEPHKARVDAFWAAAAAAQAADAKAGA